MVITLPAKRTHNVKFLQDEPAIVVCPRCHAMQTVFLDGLTGKMVFTRKFRQVGKEIYHECGSDKACRIYAAFKKWL